MLYYTSMQGYKGVTVNPELSVGSGSVNIPEEIVASVVRTAFSPNVDLLPYLDPSSTASANERALRADPNAPRLTIIGRDAVCVESLPVQHIHTARTPQLLSLMLRERAVQSPDAYLAEGFAHDLSTTHHRKQALNRAKDRLDAMLVSTDEDPIITDIPSGFGLDGIVVKDLRHTNIYRNARYAYSSEIFAKYLERGGGLPNMSEEPVFRAARAVLQEASDTKMDKQTEVRFRLLSEILSRAHRLTSPVNQDSLEPPMETLMTTYHDEIAAAFAPDWQKNAPCSYPDAKHLFFPPSTYRETKRELEVRERTAKSLCDTCPQQGTCLEAALAQKEPVGVWGGMNTEERDAFLRQRELRK